ncbi:MAG: hypothetical protein J2P47_16890, partial [Acetobacteraceae bacterium]|nr:hypothetical protein [Acetobacteraceae bacterium]
ASSRGRRRRCCSRSEGWRHRPGLRPLGTVTLYNARLTALRRVGQGARGFWLDAAGRERAADVPIRPRDPRRDRRGGLRAAAKVAFEVQRRFRELDQSIYGGIS